MDPHLLLEINQLHAEVCAALADPKRIAVLYALADKPESVMELANMLDMPQATLSRHLKILRDRGMVTAKRQGSNIYYSLRDKRVIQALDILRQVLADDLSRRSTLADALG